jgi:poly(hydroxyalkanoate) granule-associated protein
VLRESAQQVWLAGLGALAVAEEEGGKMFSTLVKRGKGYERVNKARFENMIEKVDGMRDELREGAQRTMGKLGVNLDDRMEAVVHRLGFPTRREITTLTRRVEELTRTLEKRERAPRARPRPRRVPKAAPATA